jgi:hypothetical protein
MNFIRRYWKILLGFWIISLLWWGVPRCFDSWQLEHRQAELLKAIEQRTPKAYADLISSDYKDEWKFTNEKIRRSMDDVSAQFLTLKIEAKSAEWERSDQQGIPEASYVTEFALSGKPITPIGELILSQGDQLKVPFTFVWRREGWGAWNWKLVAVKQPDLDIPSDYEPGQLSELR